MNLILNFVRPDVGRRRRDVGSVGAVEAEEEGVEREGVEREGVQTATAAKKQGAQEMSPQFTHLVFVLAISGICIDFLFFNCN